MKLAICLDKSSNTVWQHFGQTEHFLLVDLDNNQQEVVDNNGFSHRELIPYLASLGVKVLICGGIGDMAVTLLKNAGIDVIPGINGDVEKALESYQKGELMGNLSLVHNCDCHH